MKAAHSRLDFVRMARESEIRFVDEGGPDLLTVSIGPWVCGCGFRARGAGVMWDHVESEHARETTGELFPAEQSP